MVMMCIQYEQHPISSFMDDANILDARVRWYACRILLTKETQQYRPEFSVLLRFLLGMPGAGGAVAYAL